MKNALAALCVALSVGGCTSVKVVQRDDCWVRQSKRTFGGSREEIGPCKRPEPKWSDERLTRIVQECVAQADYRWQNEAISAWSRNQPLPERPSENSVLRDCMEQASRSELAENERLKKRIAELEQQRHELSARTQQDHERILESNDKLAGDLGEAANRPQTPAVATATATSEGKSSSDGRSTSDTSNDTAVSDSRDVKRNPPLAAPSPSALPKPPASSPEPEKVQSPAVPKKKPNAKPGACPPAPSEPPRPAAPVEPVTTTSSH